MTWTWDRRPQAPGRRHSEGAPCPRPGAAGIFGGPVGGSPAFPAGSPAGSICPIPGGGPWGGPRDTARGAGLGAPVCGCRSAERAAGRGREDPPFPPAAGPRALSRRAGIRRPAAAGRGRDSAPPSAAGRRRPGGRGALARVDGDSAEKLAPGTGLRDADAWGAARGWWGRRRCRWKLGVRPRPGRRRSGRRITGHKFSACLRLRLDPRGPGRPWAELEGAGSPDTGQVARMGFQLDSELGRRRNFRLRLLCVSAFELDLERGAAAELGGWGGRLRLRPAWHRRPPAGVPSPNAGAWSPGRA